MRSATPSGRDVNGALLGLDGAPVRPGHRWRGGRGTPQPCHTNPRTQHRGPHGNFLERNLQPNCDHFDRTLLTMRGYTPARPSSLSNFIIPRNPCLSFPPPPWVRPRNRSPVTPLPVTADIKDVVSSFRPQDPRLIEQQATGTWSLWGVKRGRGKISQIKIDLSNSSRTHFSRWTQEKNLWKKPP